MLHLHSSISYPIGGETWLGTRSVPRSVGTWSDCDATIILQSAEGLDFRTLLRVADGRDADPLAAVVDSRAL